MKTDRELLELAAKAAGYGEPFDWPCYHGPWNPIQDDGDALRLAVKLGIELYFEGCEEDDAVWANEVMLWTDGERMESTRRAIVRAAAAIGESMQ